jgi:O-antigen ligase
VMGPFVYHNQYAAFVELVLPAALYIALTDKSVKWLYMLIAATLYASVFIAGSRAGFILTTLELIGVPAVLIGSRKLALAGILSGAALLVGMVVLLGISAGPDYLMTRFRERDPYVIRREFLYSSIRMFLHRPMTGVGLGNWPTAYPAYALFDNGLYANQAHNDWAQWAVEGGAPMLLIMLGVAVWIFPRAVKTGWGFGGAALFLHCWFDYPIQRPAVAVVFFSLVGAISCVKSR